jgi:hypothetical protein
MKNMRQLIAIVFAATTVGVSGVTLIADDFDGNTVGALNPTGGLVTSPVADPVGGANTVLRVEGLAGGNQWQSLLGGTNYALPAGTVAGVDTITFSYRLYIPSAGAGGQATVGTGFANNDKFNSLLRINGTQPDSYPPSTQHPIESTWAFDEWVVISDSGVIPAVDNSDGTTATSELMPILSVHNVAPNTDANELIGYIDDISIDVTTSVPEPSASLFATLAAGLLASRRKRN